MRTKQILLMLLVIGLSFYLACAGGLTNNPSNLRIVRNGNYTYTYMITNNTVIYVNPSEFWQGAWKEDNNGLRVQLLVYPETNTEFVQGHVYPVSTNLILRVEWGSAVKNSGKYFLSPNGKFARFELLDINGNVIPPKPDAGTNLLKRTLNRRGGFVSFPDIARKLEYETNLPKWMSPSDAALIAKFPKTISTNIYPHIEYGKASGWVDSDIVGDIWSVTNQPPPVISLLKLDEIYSVTNEGDYTLTVEPVLYKQRIGTNILDRVDLPSVTTKIHLLPSQ
jgi:hypothetical protein